MGTATTEANDTAEKAKSEIEIARENMKKKKAGKKGKKKTEEVRFMIVVIFYVE